MMAAFLLAFLFALRPIASRDLGFHLRTGQWIVENGTFPGQDVFTYTANQSDYIDLHWLYQVVLYLDYSAFGYAGLTLLNVVLILSALALLVRRCRSQGVSLAVLAPLFLVSLLALELRMEMRPEIVSWVLLGITLAMLDAYHYRGRNLLFILPVMQAIWVNTQGLFILGWVVMAAYCLSDLVHHRRLDRPLWGWSLGALAATLLNPYGLWGVLHPLTLATRLRGSNVFQQAITELGSPWSWDLIAGDPFAPKAAFYSFYFLVIAAVVAVVISLRRQKLHNVLILIAFLIIASASLRNIPFFILVALPVVGLGLSPVPAAGTRKSSARPPVQLRRLAMHPAAAMTLTVVILLISARVVTGAWYIDARRPQRLGVGLDELHQATGAGEFLQAHDLDGILLNHIDLGGWLMWTAPQPVYIDTRLEVAGESLFREHMGSFAGGGLQRLARKTRADLIVFDPRRTPAWTEQLRTMPWRLVLWRPNVVIYARQGYAEKVPGVDLMEQVRQEITVPSEEQVRTAILAPTPSPAATWWSGFFRRQVYPEASVQHGVLCRPEREPAGGQQPLYRGDSPWAGSLP